MGSRHHIYLSSTFWDALWVIQQPIADQIQRTEPILFVERFVSIPTVFRYPRLWRRLFAWLRGARQLGTNLFVIAPLPLFHFGHRVPWLFRIELTLQSFWIRFWARAINRGQRVLWIDSPMYWSAVGRFGEHLSIYHVGDDVAEFPKSHAPTMRRLEANALRVVDIVFAASDGLASSRRLANSNTHVVWNGVDSHLYGSAGGRNCLAILRDIPEPRVAFVGVMDTWVDLKLMVEVAKALPHVHFVVAGPSRVEVHSYCALPNVHCLGVQPRESVPSILRACSAAIVPFVASSLTARIVPVKILEALAAGTMPVCTSFSSDVDRLANQGLALVARDPSHFIQLVNDAIHDDSPLRRAELSAFGLRQTWAERWREMRQVVGATCQSKDKA